MIRASRTFWEQGFPLLFLPCKPHKWPCRSAPRTAGSIRLTGRRYRIGFASVAPEVGASGAHGRTSAVSPISAMVGGGTPMRGAGGLTPAGGSRGRGLRWLGSGQPMSSSPAPTSITIPATVPPATSRRYASDATCCTMPRNIAGSDGGTLTASALGATCSKVRRKCGCGLA